MTTNCYVEVKQCFSFLRIKTPISLFLENICHNHRSRQPQVPLFHFVIFHTLINIHSAILIRLAPWSVLRNVEVTFSLNCGKNVCDCSSCFSLWWLFLFMYIQKLHFLFIKFSSCLNIKLCSRYRIGVISESPPSDRLQYLMSANKSGVFLFPEDNNSVWCHDFFPL